jgi:hypothetical protein
MQITVKSSGVIAWQTGISEQQIALDAGATIDDALNAVHTPKGISLKQAIKDSGLSPQYLVAGQWQELSYELHDGETFFIFISMAPAGG